MYKSIPPSFQHERAVGESEADLSEPDPECAGHNVGPRVEDQGLEQSNTEIENESSSCDFKIVEFTQPKLFKKNFKIILARQIFYVNQSQYKSFQI